MDASPDNPKHLETRNADSGVRHEQVSERLPDRPANANSFGEPMSRERFVSEFAKARPVLWCIAASVLRNRSEADDVLQDAAVIGLGKLSEWTPGSSFVAWMSQIVRFVALNHGRKGQRREATARLAGVEAAVTHQPNTPGALHVNTEAILGTLNSLDEAARTCFLLRTTRSMSYSEISAAVGVPEGTAMSHVFRVRKVLSERHLSASPQGGGQ